MCARNAELSTRLCERLNLRTQAHCHLHQRSNSSKSNGALDLVCQRLFPALVRCCEPRSQVTTGDAPCRLRRLRSSRTRRSRHRESADRRSRRVSLFPETTRRAKETKEDERETVKQLWHISLFSNHGRLSFPLSLSMKRKWGRFTNGSEIEFGGEEWRLTSFGGQDNFAWPLDLV